MTNIEEPEPPSWAGLYRHNHRCPCQRCDDYALEMSEWEYQMRRRSEPRQPAMWAGLQNLATPTNEVFVVADPECASPVAPVEPLVETFVEE